MDAKEATRLWIGAWDRAWRALDPAPLEAVYTEDAVHYSHPFRQPQHPLDYARWAFAEEEVEPELWWGEPFVAGERAAVEWWAVVVENGATTSLAGTPPVHASLPGSRCMPVSVSGPA